MLMRAGSNSVFCDAVCFFVSFFQPPNLRGHRSVDRHQILTHRKGNEEHFVITPLSRQCHRRRRRGAQVHTWRAPSSVAHIPALNWRFHLWATLQELTGHASFVTNFSQSSVATHLRCDWIFYDCYIANFLEIVTVKELWKSASIWRSYLQSIWGL